MVRYVKDGKNSFDLSSCIFKTLSQNRPLGESLKHAVISIYVLG
jgi:hypothetical protein